MSPPADGTGGERPSEPGDDAAVDPDRAVARTRRTYERIAEDYRERNAAVDPVEGLLEQFRAALPGTRPRVLDAGCGHGRDAAWLADRGCSVVGLDFAGAQLANASERAPGAALLQADLRALPLTAGTFDGVLAMASLLHLPDDDLPGVLAGLRRTLRPGGVLAVSTRRGHGAALETTARYGVAGRYFVAHQPAELRAHLTDAGLTVLEIDPDEAWVWALARRPDGE